MQTLTQTDDIQQFNNAMVEWAAANTPSIVPLPQPFQPTLADCYAHLVGQYLNLVIDMHLLQCGIITPVGIPIDDHIRTINNYLEALSYTREEIETFWSGEAQLTSS